MPWLVPEEKCRLEAGQKPLLFIHTPRCGGTSLTKLYKVPRQAREGRNLWHKFGMTYFFYRYKLLETSNFPMLTYENMLASTQLGLGMLIWFFELAPSLDPECTGTIEERLCPPPVPSIVMWSFAALSFVCSTFVFTASASGRVDWMRQLYALFVGKVLCGFTSSYPMLTGVGRDGYIVHWTAAKMVRYGHVSEEKFRSGAIDNFTVVRNPLSRLVSIYMYNRHGPLEPFDHFVKEWYKKWQAYRDSGSTEEWDVYCHVLPQYEFTHMDGRQLVKCVVKQEDLKQIVKGEQTTCIIDGQMGEIPPQILQALKDMPHSNRRQRSKPWHDFYTEKTIAMAREMYSEDFHLFGYSQNIPGRPDLDVAKVCKVEKVLKESPARLTYDRDESDPYLSGDTESLRSTASSLDDALSAESTLGSSLEQAAEKEEEFDEEEMLTLV